MLVGTIENAVIDRPRKIVKDTRLIHISSDKWQGSQLKGRVYAGQKHKRGRSCLQGTVTDGIKQIHTLIPKCGTVMHGDGQRPLRFFRHGSCKEIRNLPVNRACRILVGQIPMRGEGTARQDGQTCRNPQLSQCTRAPGNTRSEPEPDHRHGHALLFHYITPIIRAIFPGTSRLPS